MFEIICLKETRGVSKAVGNMSLTLEIRPAALESVRRRCTLICMLMYSWVFTLMSFHVCVFCLPH